MNIGVLASGRGSNFRVLCEAQKRSELGGGTMSVLITDKPQAGALAVAKEFGIEPLVLEPKDFASRDAHEAAVADALATRNVGLVVHAGYMRIVGKAYLSRFPNKVLNMHPALLPSFPGLHGQRQALTHGAKVSGATVHFVDEGVDTGPIVVQEAVPINEDDTEATLAARILDAEHRLYPLAVRLFCAGKLTIEGRRVRIAP